MFRPCHLFSFVEASHEQNWLMKISGSGCVCVVWYIWTSQKNLVYVSTLATSDEKNTDATTCFNSRSMPAFVAACLMICCTFWRGALMDVWKTYFNFLPSLTR